LSRWQVPESQFRFRFYLAAAAASSASLSLATAALVLGVLGDGAASAGGAGEGSGAASAGGAGEGSGGAAAVSLARAGSYSLSAPFLGPFFVFVFLVLFLQFH